MIFLIESCLAVAAVVGAFAFPMAGRAWFEACEHALAKLARRPTLAVLVVGLAALAARAALLPILPIPQPGGHDDFGYLLLADTFAHGRLTNPTHPMWVHFESLHIIWQPTYTAMFYPAQGLIMGLGKAVAGHPFWGVWLSVGLMCASICWMLQGWLPPGWALLGGLLAVIRLGTFSYWANSYFGGAVAAAGGALALGALPRIKRSQHLRDALVMGLGFTILANSRPYEGLFLGLVVAGALAVWMFGKDGPPPGLAIRDVVAPLFLMLILTAGAMGYYFWRTTGSPWQTPHFVNARTYNPAPYFPWQALRPVGRYHHRVFRDYYVDMAAVDYQRARSVAGFVSTKAILLLILGLFYLGPALALPVLMVLAMVPYGSSWKDLDPGTRFLLLVCGTVIAGSMLPIWFLPHYAAPISCAILALALEATRRLRSQPLRGESAGLFISRAVPVICFVMLVLRAGVKPLHLPEPQRWLAGGLPTWCALAPTNLERAATLAHLQQQPGRQLAIVRYGPHHDVGFHEWVYNDADIDQAKVVWGRDMGPARNRELIEYFRDRRVWLVEADEAPPKLSPYPEPADRRSSQPTQGAP
jgi:hypothetical protein